MENTIPAPDLDVSQLSAVELQHMGITVAQVRAAYVAPVAIIEPGTEFPEVWQVLGFTDKGGFIFVKSACAASGSKLPFTDKGGFIFVALRYDDRTGKLAALGVQVADDLAELRYYLCRA